MPGKNQRHSSQGTGKDTGKTERHRGGGLAYVRSKRKAACLSNNKQHCAAR